MINHSDGPKKGTYPWDSPIHPDFWANFWGSPSQPWPICQRAPANNGPNSLLVSNVRRYSHENTKRLYKGFFQYPSKIDLVKIGKNGMTCMISTIWDLQISPQVPPMAMCISARVSTLAPEPRPMEIIWHNSCLISPLQVESPDVSWFINQKKTIYCCFYSYIPNKTRNVHQVRSQRNCPGVPNLVCCFRTGLIGLFYGYIYN